MLHETLDGLVLRVCDRGDNDRYLTVLTADRGRITVLSKGSRSMRGGQMAVSQLYTYSNFECYRKGGLYILKGGSTIRSFYELSMDLDRLNLAAYLCDVTYEMTDEGEEAGEMLRLLLNAFYAIGHDLYPQSIIKAAFELRVANISGYAPDLGACAFCGCEDAEDAYLDVMNGALICTDCLGRRNAEQKNTGSYDEIREADVLCPVTRAVQAAMRYVIAAPPERLFAFDLKAEEDRYLFASCAETYLLSHLGRGFDSLNFYNTMRQDAERKTK